MELTSLIIDTVLAVLALIIAFFQFVGEKRAQKEEKAEEKKRADEQKTISGFVTKLKEIEPMLNKLYEFDNVINNLAKTDNNQPADVIKIIDAAVEQYEKDFIVVKPTLESIYNEMVKYEDKFPMAHGYGRYIIDFRTILNFEGLLRLRRKAGYDKARIEYYNILRSLYEHRDMPDDMRRTKFLNLGKETEKMIVALHEVYFSHADLIRAVVSELETKYKDRVNN